MARGIVNPVTLSTAAMFLLDSVTAFGLAFFAPTIIQSIYPHASVVTQQLYTVPPYVVGAVVCLAGSLLSWRTDRRALFLVLCAPLMMLGCILALASRAPHVRYAAIFLIASSTYLPGVMTNAQVSANVVSDTARNAAIGFNGTFGPRPSSSFPRARESDGVGSIAC